MFEIILIINDKMFEIILIINDREVRMYLSSYREWTILKITFISFSYDILQNSPSEKIFVRYTEKLFFYLFGHSTMRVCNLSLKWMQHDMKPLVSLIIVIRILSLVFPVGEQWCYRFPCDSFTSLKILFLTQVDIY